MKKTLLVLLVSLALTGFAQTGNQNSGVSIIAPIPPELVKQYEMQVVIYNEATRSHNSDIKKLTDAGWYIHSIMPFGWRIGAASSAAYKEDLMIVFIRPRVEELTSTVKEK